MAFDESLKRISSVDFFAAMPAGLYMFTSIYCAVVGNSGNVRAPTLWQTLEPLAGQLSEAPVTILLVLFAAYMIGTVFRTLSVGLVDWRSSVLNPKADPFPYPLYVGQLIEELQRHRSIMGARDVAFPEIDQELPRSVFNYWKDLLCMRAPTAFSYYQTWEARTRFFAGMFWAGIIGLVSSITIVIRSEFLPVAWQLGALSAVLAVLFYSRIPRARKQEASVLLTFIIALRSGDAEHDIRKFDDSRGSAT